MEEYLEDLGEDDRCLEMDGGGGADGFCDDLLWWGRLDGLGEPSLPTLSILGDDLCRTGDLELCLSLGGGEACCVDGGAGDLRCLGRGGKILGGDLWSLGTRGTSCGDLS